MIPDEVKDGFRKYENLKTEIKLLEAECDQLKPMLMPYVPEEGELKTDDGTFTVRSKVTYVHSMEVQADEEELKQKKQREIQDGTAVEKKGAPYLQYNPKKAGKDSDHG